MTSISHGDCRTGHGGKATGSGSWTRSTSFIPGNTDRSGQGPSTAGTFPLTISSCQSLATTEGPAPINSLRTKANGTVSSPSWGKRSGGVGLAAGISPSGRVMAGITMKRKTDGCGNERQSTGPSKTSIPRAMSSPSSSRCLKMQEHTCLLPGKGTFLLMR